VISARTLLARLNRAPGWQRDWRVWDQPLCLPSADRWLYAVLHRTGLMGRAERRFFPQVVKPGMTVLDIGANIGLYALYFSQLVGTGGSVYAFEPDPALFAALQRGRALAARENLHVYPVALGDRPGPHRLHRSWFNSGDNRVLISTGPAPTADPEITVARGDDLLSNVPALDFIKLDVQGWELHVLRGLSATLGRSPAVRLFLEYWPAGLRAAGSDPAELIAFLQERGLTLHRERGGRWIPIGSLAELERETFGGSYLNLWATHSADDIKV
jgi:FkbM family methyltransferase